MAGFELGPEAQETAKVMAAGGFGAGVLVFLRHPGSLLRVAMLFAIGIGMAAIFTAPLAGWLHLGEVQVAAGIGLLGKGIADAALRAAEDAELLSFLPFGRAKE